MERTRIYYRALGYTNDYVWAYHADVPFARPVKPIGAMKVALISTAGPGDRAHRDERNRRHAWSGLVARPPETFDSSEEPTSELQSLMRTSYAVFCLKKKKP